MRRKSQDQGMNDLETQPQIAQTETQEHLELTTAEGQIIHMEEETRKEGSKMKEKNDGNGYICPICKSETPLSVAGKGTGGTKFLMCTSQTCQKPPFNFTLFFMPSSRAPVIWPLEFGSLHQINSNKTKSS